MGQLYAALNVSKKQAMFSGMKLMELAWIGGRFMNSFMGLMVGDWAGDEVFLVGDQADLRLFGSRERRWQPAMRRAFERLGVSADALQGDAPVTLYSFASEHFDGISRQDRDAAAERGARIRYLINRATSSYVDLKNCPIESVHIDGGDAPEFPSLLFEHIHPLALLLAMGVGRGFGDFRGDNRYTSFWVSTSRSIRVTDEESAKTALEGLREWRPNFTEREDAVEWSEELAQAQETINALLRAPAAKNEGTCKAFLYEMENALRRVSSPPSEDEDRDRYQHIARRLLQEHQKILPLEDRASCCYMTVDEAMAALAAVAPQEE